MNPGDVRDGPNFTAGKWKIHYSSPVHTWKDYNKANHKDKRTGHPFLGRFSRVKDLHGETRQDSHPRRTTKGRRECVFLKVMVLSMEFREEFLLNRPALPLLWD